VQFVVGAILGALIGFSLWMSLPPLLTYSWVAGIACVSAVALLVGWFVARNPFRRIP
jgi:ABC-type antimicrobial peptide transport system permease subunit